MKIERNPGKVILADEGIPLRLQGSVVRVKVTGHETHGAYALLECVTCAGEGVPPHIHAEEDEALYVLEGEIELVVDDRRVLLGPGAYAYLPRCTTHSYTVTGKTPGRLLITVSPAGLELYFAEMARLHAEGKSTACQVISLSSEYGIRFVGPFTATRSL